MILDTRWYILFIEFIRDIIFPATENLNPNQDCRFGYLITLRFGDITIKVSCLKAILLRNVKVIVLNVDQIAMQTLLERLKIGGKMNPRYPEPTVVKYTDMKPTGFSNVVGVIQFIFSERNGFQKRMI